MKTIIIVDDDIINTTLLQMLLEIEGYQTVPCKNIEEGKAAAYNKADAFVIDCHLAGGASGLSLLRDIRMGKTAVSSNTVAIMASGDHRLEVESLESGADRFLLKPYSPNELSQELSKLLAKREHSG
jgi:DNA-binding response OmpR family regulator